VQAGRSVTLATARPDLKPTTDRVRCASANASSSAPGAPALAAVDGSTATDWTASSPAATLTVPVHGAGPIRHAVVIWGSEWPAQPKPNVHPAPRPVIARRATQYALLISRDGRHWHQVTSIRRTSGTLDSISFAAARARFVRLRIAAAANRKPALLQELRVTG
jgi:hypothetical protein